MLIGMRNAMMAGGGFSAKSYVQDGLVGLWDGIENAGWGVHDPNATSWTDLTGLQPNCPLWQSGIDSGAWRNNGLENKTRSATYGFTRSIGFNINSPIRYMSAIISARACTFEFIFIPGFNHTGSICYGPQMYNGSSNFLSMGNSSAESTSGMSDYLFFSGIHLNSEYPYRFKNYQDNISFAQRRYALSMRGFYKDERWWGQVVRNGVQYTPQTGTAAIQSDGKTVNATADNGDFSNLTVIPSNANPSACGINCYAGAYCYRIYSRCLTEEEVMHNWKIDKARFNLP